MYGPCLSAIVGGRALTPPTRHSLGKLLPHQQADRPWAHPQVTACINTSHLLPRSINYVVLSGISSAFAGLSRAQGQITHVLLTRPPLY